MSDKQADKLDVLFGKVYLPVFMQKLASKGVKVTSEADLQESLKIAAMLRMHQQAEPVEQAPSAIKMAAANLEAMTFGQKSATAGFLQDPEVVAALS